LAGSFFDIWRRALTYIVIAIVLVAAVFLWLDYQNIEVFK